MRERLKKALGITLMVSMIGASIVGCSGKSDAGDKPKEVSITLWEQAPPEIDAEWDKIVKEFQQKNPGITVTREHFEVEALRQQFMNTAQAGEGPELVYGPDDNIGVFASAGVIQDVKGVVSEDFLKTLDPNALKGNEFNNTLYGIPDKSGNALMLLYNKKLVDKAPETWDELIAKSKEMTKNLDDKDAANDQYGLVYFLSEPFFWSPFLGGFGGTAFKEGTNTPNLNNQSMIDSLQFAQDLKVKHKITPKEADYNTADSLFKQGQAAFTINGPWSITAYKEAGIDVGIAVLPKHTTGKNSTPFISTKTYMINKNLDESKKEAVVKFLEFANSKDSQLKTVTVSNEVPTNLEAQKDPIVTKNELVNALKAQIENGTPMPIIPEMRAVWDGIRPQLEGVMSGKIKPADAAKSAQDAAEKAIKDMGL